jgi:trk system potassium uptake protein TrkH
MQLYKAETPGPIKDSKLTPRITQTAKALWYIYLGLTVLCTIGYWMAGMSIFDATGHAFSTVSIGGYSTHDASLGYFNSTAIEMVAILFMLLSGANFGLHFLVLRKGNAKIYFRDPEFKLYTGLLLTVAVFTVAGLYFGGTFEDPKEALSKGLFQAVSIGTTAGFTTGDYYAWPGALAILLLFSSFVGGCAGSTGGGIKVIRFLLLIKQGAREMARLLHPNAQIPIRVG